MDAGSIPDYGIAVFYFAPMNTKRTPEQKAEQRRMAAEVKRKPRSARRNPYSGALAVACEQCEIEYTKFPAPRNLAEFYAATSPLAPVTYTERQMLVNIPESFEIVTEDEGRWNASGSREKWAISV